MSLQHGAEGNTLKPVQSIALLLVAAAAIALSAWLGETVGVKGACLGLGIAVLMCVVSNVLMRRTQHDARKAHRFVIGGIIASFGILIVSTILVGVFAAAFLEYASLTTLAVYLVYRAFEAAEFGRPNDSGTQFAAKKPSLAAGYETSASGGVAHREDLP